ncbi:hypothetical protein GQ600_20114 [Phytophthora cactorum]|nr:hypothetical protein GQ600_20114 [Phytophthora cactorum]
MKFNTFLVAVMAVLGAVAAADQPVVKTPVEALEKAQASTLPDGVTLTGVTEKIDPPAGAAATLAKEDHKGDDDNDKDGDNDKDDNKEQYGWGLGGGLGGLGGLGGWGLGGWGGWGGWGGYGPYRFGFMCGGVPGWAYPMGYWNMYGAGLYGGGCGLVKYQPSTNSTKHSETMKFNTFLVAVMAVLGAVAAADQPVVKTPVEALEKAQASTLPDGVTLTGVTEKIDPPAGAAATLAKEDHKGDDDNDKDGDNDKDDNKEQYGWGLGGGLGGLGGLGGWGLGGWGGWGGWGGYGPYRFGFMCGGVPGWAYPMGYWNMYGAGLYGGGCGLGIPMGGLYYC